MDLCDYDRIGDLVVFRAFPWWVKLEQVFGVRLGLLKLIELFL